MLFVGFSFWHLCVKATKLTGCFLRQCAINLCFTFLSGILKIVYSVFSFTESSRRVNSSGNKCCFSILRLVLFVCGDDDLGMLIEKVCHLRLYFDL